MQVVEKFGSKSTANTPLKGGAAGSLSPPFFGIAGSTCRQGSLLPPVPVPSRHYRTRSGSFQDSMVSGQGGGRGGGMGSAVDTGQPPPSEYDDYEFDDEDDASDAGGYPCYPYGRGRSNSVPNFSMGGGGGGAADGASPMTFSRLRGTSGHRVADSLLWPRTLNLFDSRYCCCSEFCGVEGGQ